MPRSDTGSTSNPLRSPLARRLLALFALCSLLPATVVAVLGYRHVVGDLREAGARRLHLQARTIAMGVLERLELLEGDLELLSLLRAASVDGRAAPGEPGRWQRFADHFEEMLVVSGDRREVLLGDGAAGAVPALTDGSLAHLAAGGTVLVSAPAVETVGTFWLGRAVAAGRPESGVVWGRAEPRFLFGLDQGRSLPHATELAILNGDWQPIVRSTGLSRDFGETVRDRLAEGGERSFEWLGPDESHLASAWQMPLSITYLERLWTVVVSQPRSVVRAPAERFRRQAPLFVLLTLWLVALVGLRQIRRQLGPLYELRAATQRIAERDFSEPVRVTGGDELEDLAHSFNRMADQLRRQLLVFEAVEELGRSSLAGDDERRCVAACVGRLGAVFPARTLRVAIVSEAGDDEIVARVDRAADAESSVSVDVRPVSRERPPSAGDAVPAMSAATPLPAGESLEHPIVVEGRRIGEIRMEPLPGEAFDQLSLRHAAELASQIGRAVRHIRLRRQVEAERRRLSVVIEHLPSGVVLLGADRRVVLTNRLGRSLLPLAGITNPDEPIERLGEIEIDDLLASPESGPPAEIACDSDAGPRLLAVEAATTETGGGATRTILLMRDVTEAREIEQRARDQERLASVGQLSAGIAHDFNNILQGIMTAGELLALDAREEDRRQLATSVVETARRGARVIRQILDFSRQPSRPGTRVEVNQMVSQCLEMLANVIPEHITITAHPSATPLFVDADPTQLQQMITNLAVNARDAMEGGGELRVEISRVSAATRSGLDGGERVRIDVSDTGSGIPPEIQDHIFEPFFTTRSGRGGTGLGLAQVRTIVDRHGGRVSVSSVPGRGTTFRVLLPVSTLADGATDEEPATAVGRLPGGRGETVLVVDNEPSILDTVKEGLDRLGYSVVAAPDAAEALRMVDDGNEPIAVLLTDLMLPGMMGDALASHLVARQPDLRVIAMSGSSTRGHDGRWDAQLVKPFGLRELAHILADVLGRGHDGDVDR